MLTICFILAINVFLYWLKWWLNHSSWLKGVVPSIATYAATIHSVLLSLTISVVNKLYVSLSEFLVEYENPRTETEYRDRKISKVRSFL